MVAKAILQIEEKIFYLHDEEHNTIGRNRDARVNLKNASVSKLHAIITIHDAFHYVSDLRSTNCTFLNNEKLDSFKLYKLKDGDKLKFGDILSFYKILNEPAVDIKQNEASQTLSESFYNANTQTLQLETGENKVNVDFHEMATQAQIFDDNPSKNIHYAETQRLMDEQEEASISNSIHNATTQQILDDFNRSETPDDLVMDEILMLEQSHARECEKPESPIKTDIEKSKVDNIDESSDDSLDFMNNPLYKNQEMDLVHSTPQISKKLEPDLNSTRKSMDYSMDSFARINNCNGTANESDIIPETQSSFCRDGIIPETPVRKPTEKINSSEIRFELSDVIEEQSIKETEVMDKQKENEEETTSKESPKKLTNGNEEDHIYCQPTQKIVAGGDHIYSKPSEELHQNNQEDDAYDQPTQKLLEEDKTSEEFDLQPTQALEKMYNDGNSSQNQGSESSVENQFAIMFAPIQIDAFPATQQLVSVLEANDTLKSDKAEDSDDIINESVTETSKFSTTKFTKTINIDCNMTQDLEAMLASPVTRKRKNDNEEDVDKNVSKRQKNQMESIEKQAISTSEVNISDIEKKTVFGDKNLIDVKSGEENSELDSSKIGKRTVKRTKKIFESDSEEEIMESVQNLVKVSATPKTKSNGPSKKVLKLEPKAENSDSSENFEKKTLPFKSKSITQNKKSLTLGNKGGTSGSSQESEKLTSKNRRTTRHKKILESDSEEETNEIAKDLVEELSTSKDILNESNKKVLKIESKVETSETLQESVKEPLTLKSRRTTRNKKILDSDSEEETNKNAQNESKAASKSILKTESKVETTGTSQESGKESLTSKNKRTTRNKKSLELEEKTNETKQNSVEELLTSKNKSSEKTTETCQESKKQPLISKSKLTTRSKKSLELESKTESSETSQESEKELLISKNKRVTRNKKVLEVESKTESSETSQESEKETYKTKRTTRNQKTLEIKSKEKPSTSKLKANQTIESTKHSRIIAEPNDDLDLSLGKSIEEALDKKSLLKRNSNKNESVAQPKTTTTRKNTTILQMEIDLKVPKKTKTTADTTVKPKMSINNNDSILTPNRSRRQLKPKVVFSMMDDPEMESAVRQMGGLVVDTVDAATVLITESVKRSQKLLTAVGQGKPICSPQWIHESKKQYGFLDPWDFIIHDEEAEKKWKFSLREAIERGKNEKLLNDYTFQVMVNSGTAECIKKAIEACGGKCVTRNLGKSTTKHIFIVSTKENSGKYGKIVKQFPNIKVVLPEAIFDGVLRQEFHFEDYYV